MSSSLWRRRPRLLMGLMVPLGVVLVAVGVAVAGFGYPPPAPDDVTNEPVANTNRALVQSLNTPLSRYEMYSYGSDHGLCLDVRDATTGDVTSTCGMDMTTDPAVCADGRGLVPGCGDGSSAVHPEAFNAAVMDNPEHAESLVYGITNSDVARVRICKWPCDLPPYNVIVDVQATPSISATGQVEGVPVNQQVGASSGTYKHFLSLIPADWAGTDVRLTALDTAGGVLDAWTTKIGAPLGPDPTE